VWEKERERLENPGGRGGCSRGKVSERSWREFNSGAHLLATCFRTQRETEKKQEKEK